MNKSLRDDFEPAVRDWANDPDNRAKVTTERMAAASIAISIKRIADHIIGLNSEQLACFVVDVIKRVDREQL